MMTKILLASANPTYIKAACYAGFLIFWAAAAAGLDTTSVAFVSAQLAQIPG